MLSDSLNDLSSKAAANYNGHNCLFSIGLEGTFNGTLGPFSSNSVKFLTSLTNYGNNFRGRDRRLFYSRCQIPGKPWGLGPWWELVPRVRHGSGAWVGLGTWVLPWGPGLR